MPRYLVTLYRPEGYDPSTEDQAMHEAIDLLNLQMIAANVRVFVGGLEPPTQARTLHPQSGGPVTSTPGPAQAAAPHPCGLWILEAASLNEATEWGRKAALACRGDVEVRAFL